MKQDLWELGFEKSLYLNKNSISSSLNTQKRELFLDDAGIGAVIGGVTIGLMDKEGKGDFVTIPVEYFQYNPNLKDRPYKSYLIKIVEKLLKKAYKSGDKLHICRGNLFNILKPILNGLEIDYDRSKIVGKPQEEIEKFHANYLNNICGIPFKTYTGHAGRTFMWFIGWLKEDKSRLKYAKTGWKKLKNWL